MNTYFKHFSIKLQSSSVQSLSRVQLFATPWIAARQASLSITNSQSSLKLTSIESVTPSRHLILCCPLFLLPPIPPSIRVFSNESTLRMRWPELTHWRRLWWWEGLEAGGEGDDRGWDGWMASLTPWTWVWANSGSWWWTGRPGVLRFMGSQTGRHDWATKLNWRCQLL